MPSFYMNLDYFNPEQRDFLLRGEALMNERTSSMPEMILQKGDSVVLVRGKYPKASDVIDDILLFESTSINQLISKAYGEDAVTITTEKPSKCGQKTYTLEGNIYEQNEINYIHSPMQFSMFTQSFFEEHKDMIVSIFTTKWQRERDLAISRLKKALDFVSELPPPAPYKQESNPN